MIVVVIPFFLREPGVLARSLRSVAAQQACAMPVHVMVVDDASPTPAEPELRGIEWPADTSIEILRQANGGPGAARNRALDHLPAGTRYVAFLDSDDEWSAHHLTRAIAALDAGWQFYFADHLQLGGDKPAFARAGRIRPAEHPIIPNTPAGLHAFNGDFFVQVLTANVVGTSTVVIDTLALAAIRFRVEFRAAGEDYLFWMECAKAGARVAFSSEVEAVYGRGVNVYARSGWGTDGFALRVHNEMEFKRLTTQLFVLTAEQTQNQLRAVSRLRDDFAGDMLHRLLHRKPLDWRLVRRQFAAEPTTALSLPRMLLRKLADRRSGHA